MSRLHIQAARYAVVGIINTAVGFSLILVLMASGLGDISANFFGYFLGIAVGFVLNGRWTFSHAKLTRVELIKYLTVVITAYLANLLALLIVRDAFAFGSVAGQFAGVLAYAAVGFIGMRQLAFKSR